MPRRLGVRRTAGFTGTSAVESQESRVEIQKPNIQPQRITEYVEVPVSNSADEKAWRTAKRKTLDRFGTKPIHPVEFFRLVEDIKELALSGDPQGNIYH